MIEHHTADTVYTHILGTISKYFKHELEKSMFLSLTEYDRLGYVSTSFFTLPIRCIYKNLLIPNKSSLILQNRTV